ncbi:GntR family transcriptional regulator [Microbacterium sp. Root166]|uniref:GntR family transcriptional regulator n=1 Tax=Microbacterium sp. Root166 TaxID=1736478 RepID=UPI00138F8D39|nr:GntR family transcriptional regulator [Microbacterium sp. Root166]
MATTHARLDRPAARPKLADEVADSLRQAILQGAYEKDAKLGMEELAEELGVSIMPVREALIALSNEGLVNAEPRRGFRANPLTQADLDDIFQIQAQLGGVLAARAAREATPEDVETLRVLHAELEEASRLPAGEERSARLEHLNGAFHRHINKIPTGDRLRWFLRLTNRFVRRDLFDSVPGMTEGALRDHPAIIDAIAAGDSQAARNLMEAHFIQGSDLVGYTLPADTQ